MISTKLKTLLSFVSILVYALLYNLSFSPFDYKFTVYLSLIGYFFLISDKEKKQIIIYSFFYGFFIFLIGTSWIFNSLYNFGGENYVLSTIMTLLFISFNGFFFILIGYFLNNNFLKDHKLLIPIYVASIWTSIEILRSYIFGGFPWLLIGTSQINFIYNNIFPMFGTYFISFITIMISMIIFLILKDKDRSYNIKYFFISISFVILLNAPIFHQDKNNDLVMRASIIQPNINQL